MAKPFGKKNGENRFARSLFSQGQAFALRRISDRVLGQAEKNNHPGCSRRTAESGDHDSDLPIRAGHGSFIHFCLPYEKVHEGHQETRIFLIFHSFVSLRVLRGRNCEVRQEEKTIIPAAPAGLPNPADMAQICRSGPGMGLSFLFAL